MLAEPLPPTDEVVALSDAELVAELGRCAELRRQVDARAAVLSAEIERRSRRELGHSGLAQRAGVRSGVDLVQRVAGTSGREARTLVAMGGVLAAESAAKDAAESGLDPALVSLDGFVAPEPWVAPVSAAVRRGRLGVDAAHAIRAGLGAPSPTVEAQALRAAAERLVARAARIGVDRLAREARAERDAIDAAGIAEREAARYERRYLRLSPAEDGMTRVHGLLDPESAAIVSGAFDRITAPRRGGPRFVDAAERERARRIADDPRTTAQLQLDALVQLVRVAVATDDGAVFGRYEAGVRVHITAGDLAARRGGAGIEGQSVAVSAATAERIACAQGVVPVVFDDAGQCVDVGRDQRLFTRRQRIGLAARDGGCRAPDCEAPPNFTEAHHIDEWAAHDGRTDLADGVLLCRFHHMWVHNHGYRVRREGAEYWLEPPPDHPDAGTRIPMPARNPVRRS